MYKWHIHIDWFRLSDDGFWFYTGFPSERVFRIFWESCLLFNGTEAAPGSSFSSSWSVFSIADVCLQVYQRRSWQTSSMWVQQQSAELTTSCLSKQYRKCCISIWVKPWKINKMANVAGANTSMGSAVGHD